MKKEEILTQTWFPAIKGANRDLIKAAGGIDRVALLLGCSTALVGNWNNWAMADLMPTWAMVTLEADLGRSILSRAYAVLAGATVSEAVAPAPRGACLNTESAAMMTELAEYLGLLALVSADGKHTPAELMELLPYAIDLRDQVKKVITTIYATLGPEASVGDQS